MQYVVFDLEMTGWKSRIHYLPNGKMYINDYGNKLYLKVNYHEVIEIGAYKLDENFEIIDKFQSYIKPINHLSKYCINLTRITENDLSNAPRFKDAMDDFIKWINFDNNTKLYTWSTNDRRQLFMEAEKRSYNKDKIKKIFSNYIDLQKQFSKIYNNEIHAHKKGYIYGLDIVMKMLDIKIGKNKQLHSALTDAEYTAKILQIINKYNINVNITLNKKENI